MSPERERARAVAGADPRAVADPALSARELAVGYPTTDGPVVEADRVVVPEGSVTAFVGPNGSGKSTLLKALAAQLVPEAGAAYLDGRDVQAYDAKALARELGLLAQENDPPDGVTVAELAYRGRYPHLGFLERAGEADAAAVERALSAAGVTHLRDAELGTLSGGQKQLAWLAMALAQEPAVMLLDEPTNHLDMHHQLRVLDVVRERNAQEGVTVGLVLHDVAQAVRVADYLVVMQDGEPHDWGPPADVVTEELLASVFGVVATVDRSGETVRVHPHRPVRS